MEVSTIPEFRQMSVLHAASNKKALPFSDNNALSILTISTSITTCHSYAAIALFKDLWHNGGQNIDIQDATNHRL